MGLAVTADGRTSGPEKLMQAPKPLTPNESQTFDFSNPTFDWDPTPGASSYTVEVCRDPECGQLVDRAVGVKMSRWTPRVPPHRRAVLARECCERERSRQLHLPRHEVHHPDLLAPARGSALGSTTMALPLASLGSLVFLVALAGSAEAQDREDEGRARAHSRRPRGGAHGLRGRRRRDSSIRAARGRRPRKTSRS